MWKDSSFSSKNEDETENDVAEEGSKPTALHNKAFDHPEKDDKETLLNMNKKLGIEMPDCLVTSFHTNSNLTATTVKNFKPLAEVGKNISPSTKRLESKLDSLIIEMRKLRQIDHEILFKFARINHNMDEVKWLMEERLQDMDDMEDFPPITTTPNHYNGFTTTSHSITDPQNKAFRRTNDLEKSTGKPPPQPAFSPSPSSTLTTNHLRPRQQQHKRTTSQLSRSSSSTTASSSSSSMVSEDERQPAAAAIDTSSSARAEKASQPPRPRPRLHLASAPNTNHASSNHRTSPTCCNTLKTSHEALVARTTISSSSSSSDTANGNSVQGACTLEGSTTNTIERRESNNNNSRFVMKSRTLSHSSVPLHCPPQQPSLTRSNTTVSSSSSTASKFHRNLANHLARLGENIKFSTGKKSKSEKVYSNGGGSSSVWRKLRRRTSDVSSSSKSGGITRSTSASAASPSSAVGFTPRTAPLIPDAYDDDEDDVTYL